MNGNGVSKDLDRASNNFKGSSSGAGSHLGTDLLNIFNKRGNLRHGDKSRRYTILLTQVS